MTAITARLVELYSTMPGRGMIPFLEEVLTTQPSSPCFRIRGRMVLMPLRTDLKLMSMAKSMSS